MVLTFKSPLKPTNKKSIMNRSEPNFSIQKLSSALLPSTCAAIAVSALLLGSFGLVANAQSTPMLKNITTGETLFNDDFESITVPATGTLNIPTTNSPSVGTWAPGLRTNDDGRLFVGVTNETRSGVVSQQDNNFFMLSTNAGANTGQAWQGNGVIANSGLGDTIEANIAFNLSSGSNRALFYLWGGPSQNVLLGAFGLEGNLAADGFNDYSVTSHNGTDFQQTSLNFSPDVWNTLTISHVNGNNNDYAISINGGTSVTYAGLATAATHETNFVNAIYFNQTTSALAGTTVYFDAIGIPEPSSSALLLGVGAILMISRRKIRR